MTLNYSKILKNSNGDTSLLESKDGGQYFALPKSKELQSPYTITPLVDSNKTWKALSAEKLNDTDTTGSVVWNSAKEIKEFQYTINDVEKTWTQTNKAGTILQANSTELLKAERIHQTDLNQDFIISSETLKLFGPTGSSESIVHLDWGDKEIAAANILQISSKAESGESLIGSVKANQAGVTLSMSGKDVNLFKLKDGTLYFRQEFTSDEAYTKTYDFVVTATNKAGESTTQTFKITPRKTIKVSNNADKGDGSFRWALVKADAYTERGIATEIEFKNIDDLVDVGDTATDALPYWTIRTNSSLKIPRGDIRINVTNPKNVTILGRDPETYTGEKRTPFNGPLIQLGALENNNALELVINQVNVSKGSVAGGNGDNGGGGGLGTGGGYLHLSGDVTITNSVIQGNQVRGGKGGEGTRYGGRGDKWFRPFGGTDATGGGSSGEAGALNGGPRRQHPWNSGQPGTAGGSHSDAYGTAGGNGRDGILGSGSESGGDGGGATHMNLNDVFYAGWWHDKKWSGVGGNGGNGGKGGYGGGSGGGGGAGGNFGFERASISRASVGKAGEPGEWGRAGTNGTLSPEWHNGGKKGNGGHGASLGAGFSSIAPAKDGNSLTLENIRLFANKALEPNGVGVGQGGGKIHQLHSKDIEIKYNDIYYSSGLSSGKIKKLDQSSLNKWNSLTTDQKDTAYKSGYDISGDFEKINRDSINSINTNPVIRATSFVGNTSNADINNTVINLSSDQNQTIILGFEAHGSGVLRAQIDAGPLAESINDLASAVHPKRDIQKIEDSRKSAFTFNKILGLTGKIVGLPLGSDTFKAYDKEHFTSEFQPTETFTPLTSDENGFNFPSPIYTKESGTRSFIRQLGGLGAIQKNSFAVAGIIGSVVEMIQFEGKEDARIKKEIAQAEKDNAAREKIKEKVGDGFLQSQQIDTIKKRSLVIANNVDLTQDKIWIPDLGDRLEPELKLSGDKNKLIEISFKGKESTNTPKLISRLYLTQQQSQQLSEANSEAYLKTLLRFNDDNQIWELSNIGIKQTQRGISQNNISTGFANDIIEVNRDQGSTVLIPTKTETYGGDDLIKLDSGKNYVDAGTGDDKIAPGIGEVTINGGLGFDKVDYSNIRTAVTITANETDEEQFTRFTAQLVGQNSNNPESKLLNIEKFSGFGNSSILLENAARPLEEVNKNAEGNYATESYYYSHVGAGGTIKGSKFDDVLELDFGKKMNTSTDDILQSNQVAILNGGTGFNILRLSNLQELATPGRTFKLNKATESITMTKNDSIITLANFSDIQEFQTSKGTSLDQDTGVITFSEDTNNPIQFDEDADMDVDEPEPIPEPELIPEPEPTPEPEPVVPSPNPESFETADGFTQFTDAGVVLTNQSDIKYRLMGGDDYLEVIGGNNFANGNKGEDKFVLRGGIGEYLGGKDSDTFEVIDADDGTLISANRGADIIIGSVSGVIYRAGKDDDVIAVSQGKAWGDLGNDVFRAVNGEGYAEIQDYTIGEDVVELSMDGTWIKVGSGLMFTDTSGDKLMLLLGINDVEQVTVV